MNPTKVHVDMWEEKKEITEHIEKRHTNQILLNNGCSGLAD